MTLHLAFSSDAQLVLELRARGLHQQDNKKKWSH